MSYTEACSTAINPIYKTLDRALQQIRVIVLHGSEDTAEHVRATLETSSVVPGQPMREYQAISYSWGRGKSSSKKRIILNGLDFEAPASAVLALEHLRLAHDSRCLWIDALCINQADISERETQVTLMYNIYKHSSTTIIWLGRADDNTEAAVHFCEAVACHVSADFLADGSVSEAQDSQFASLEYAGSECLGSIFRRRWFRRLWVFQEVVASDNCICHLGRYTIAWRSVELAYEYSLYMIHRDIHSLSGRRCSNIGEWYDVQDIVELPQNIRHFRGMTPSLQPLTDAVRATRCLEASDSRDKIYGVLSLASSGSNARLFPDYRRSARQTFPAAIREMIRESKTLAVTATDLHQWPIKLQSHHGEDWPSWTTRLDQPLLKWSDSTLPLYEGYTASLDAMPMVKDVGPHDHLDVLCVAGFLVDTVESIIACGRDNDSILPMVAKIHHTALRGVRSNTEQVLTSHTLYGTFLAGRYDDHNLQETDRKYYSAFLSLMACPPKRLEGARAAMNDFEFGVFDAIFNTCHNRCFFLLRDGRCGLGPYNMEPGDIVVVLFGLSWPIVLRPLETGFRMVGLCFVAGIMEGQAVTAWRQACGCPRWFDIY